MPPISYKLILPVSFFLSSDNLLFFFNQKKTHQFYLVLGNIETHAISQKSPIKIAENGISACFLKNFVSIDSHIHFWKLPCCLLL